MNQEVAEVLTIIDWITERATVTGQSPALILGCDDFDCRAQIVQALEPVLYSSNSTIHNITLTKKLILHNPAH